MPYLWPAVQKADIFMLKHIDNSSFELVEVYILNENSFYHFYY